MWCDMSALRSSSNICLTHLGLRGNLSAHFLFYQCCCLSSQNCANGANWTLKMVSQYHTDIFIYCLYILVCILSIHTSIYQYAYQYASYVILKMLNCAGACMRAIQRQLKTMEIQHRLCSTFCRACMSACRSDPSTHDCTSWLSR